MTNVWNALCARVSSLLMGLSALAIALPISSHAAQSTNLASDTVDHWEGMPAFFDAGVPNFYALSPISCFVAEQALIIDAKGSFAINTNRNDVDEDLLAVKCDSSELGFATDESFLYDNTMACTDACEIPCEDSCITENEVPIGRGVDTFGVGGIDGYSGYSGFGHQGGVTQSGFGGRGGGRLSGGGVEASTNTPDNPEEMPAFFDAGVPNFYALSPISCFVAEQAMIVDSNGSYSINTKQSGHDDDNLAVQCDKSDLDITADGDFLYDNLDDAMACSDTCETPCDDTCATDSDVAGGGAVGAYGGGGGGGYSGFGGGGGGGFGGGSAEADASAKAKVIVKVKVPEPSTYILLCSMALVAYAISRRKGEKGEEKIGSSL